MKKEITKDENFIIKPKKKTKDELYVELFSILDKQIQNMPWDEYQDYKRNRQFNTNI